MSAAKHTAGPLAVAISDGDIPSAHCRLEAENQDVVAIVTLPFPFDTNYTERDANAHRLALAWNCHEQMLEALIALVAAQSMSCYGDSSDFVWPIQTMRKPGEHAYGYICPTHGLGYTSSCVCCRDDYEKHSARKDRQAAAHRDGVLKAASDIAAAAIARATGAAQ